MITVPFYSQAVNWAGEDSGFPSLEEAGRWQSNACGIASLRMVIAAFTGRVPGYWDLLQQGLALGGYNEVGWIHAKLIDLAAAHGVPGRAHRRKTVADLAASLDAGNLAIASVTPAFLGGRLKPDGTVWGKGGHLVVALRTTAEGLACHHPSSIPEGNWVDRDLPLDLWEASFSGNFLEFGR